MADNKYLDYEGVKYLAQKIYTRMDTQDANKVDKETGKGLSTNDLTNELKSNYDDAVTKANALTTAGAEANKINTIKINGVASKPDSSKAVDITVPTKVSELANDSGYQTESQVASSIATALGKITELSGEFVSSVDELPEIGKVGCIYFVPHSHSDENDSYDEYMWLFDGYEKIGNTDVDLSNYLKTTDVTALSNTEIDTALASL